MYVHVVGGNGGTQQGVFGTGNSLMVNIIDDTYTASRELTVKEQEKVLENMDKYLS
jgi:hypothetical protein